MMTLTEVVVRMAKAAEVGATPQTTGLILIGVDSVSQAYASTFTMDETITRLEQIIQLI